MSDPQFSPIVDATEQGITLYSVVDAIQKNAIQSRIVKSKSIEDVRDETCIECVVRCM